MFGRMLATLRGQYWGYRTEVSILSSITKVAELRSLTTELSARQPDNLAGKGFKVFSQNDEDGIIEAIFDQVAHDGTFLEIGVENGRECNSHYLMLKGWRGAWVEADDAQNKRIRSELGATEFPGHFKLFETFATTSNIDRIYRQACAFTGATELDLFSLDIDGQDLFILEALLSAGAKPRVLCLEYNSKFPPTLSISVAPTDNWQRENDDYYGASLVALNDVAKRHGYVLLTCNVVGVNTFFIREEFAAPFKLYPLKDVYQPFRMNLASYPSGFAPSLKFLRDELQSRPIA